MILSYTGERLTTNVYNDSTVAHLHRYGYALEYVKDKVVLDIACGEGYGTDILSGKASFVYGADISDEAIRHAQSKYNKQNIKFLKGYAHEIPLEDESVDVVVSFETIEHHDKHHEMISECKRVLKKDGILIISSPDKYYYSDSRNYKNTFHVKELYQQEFYELIKACFTNLFLLKQGNTCGNLIYNTENEKGINIYSGDYDTIDKRKDVVFPEFNLIVASNTPLACPNNSFFESELINKGLIDEANKYKNMYLNIQQSAYYKLGKLLLKPFNFLKNSTSKK